MVRIYPFTGYCLFQNSFSSFSSNMIYLFGLIRSQKTWLDQLQCPSVSDFVKAKMTSDDQGIQTHLFWNWALRLMGQNFFTFLVAELLGWLEGWLFPSHGDRGRGQCRLKKKKKQRWQTEIEKNIVLTPLMECLHRIQGWY